MISASYLMAFLCSFLAVKNYGDMTFMQWFLVFVVGWTSWKMVRYAGAIRFGAKRIDEMA